MTFVQLLLGMVLPVAALHRLQHVDAAPQPPHDSTPEQQHLGTRRLLCSTSSCRVWLRRAAAEASDLVLHWFELLGGGAGVVTATAWWLTASALWGTAQALEQRRAVADDG